MDACCTQAPEMWDLNEHAHCILLQAVRVVGRTTVASLCLAFLGMHK